MNKYKLILQQNFFKRGESSYDNNGERKTITNIIYANNIKFIGYTTYVRKEIKNYEIGDIYYGPLEYLLFDGNNILYNVFGDPYFKLYQIIDDQEVLLLEHTSEYNWFDYNKEFQLKPVIIKK